MIELIKQMPLAERKQWLEANADNITEGEYFQQFGDEEIQQVQADLSDYVMKVSSLKDEKKELTAAINARIKEQEKNVKQAIKALKENGEMLTGTIYEIRDQDRKMVDCFDSTGHLVNSRRMRPDERQLTINRQAI